MVRFGEEMIDFIRGRFGFNYPKDDLANNGNKILRYDSILAYYSKTLLYEGSLLSICEIFKVDGAKFNKISK